METLAGNLKRAFAVLGWWGPQMRAAERDRAAQLELENKKLREQAVALAEHNQRLMEAVAGYRSANQSLFSTHQALAEAAATRNTALRDRVLEEMADGWRAHQAQICSGRIH